MRLIFAFWSLLTRRDRFFALALVAGMIVGSALEALGIGLVAPFLAALLAGDASAPGHLNRWAITLGGGGGQMSVALRLGALLLLAFAAKNVYLGFLAYSQYRFIFNRELAFSTRLLNAYLRKPYTFFLGHNSVELVRILSVDVPIAFSQLVTPLASVIVESLVASALVVLLLIFEPLPTLGVLVLLGGGGFAFYRAIHRRLVRAGEATQRGREGMALWSSQGLGSIKAARVSGREKFFSDRYFEFGKIYVAAMRRYRVMSDAPRLIVEVLAVAGMLGIAALALAENRGPTSLLPVMAVFGLSAARLMPAFTRIITSLASIRYATPSFRALERELRSERKDLDQWADAVEEDFEFSKELRFDSVSFFYPDSRGPALRDVSLSIPKGAQVALVGASGAGKSTVVDLALGVLDPASGKIEVDGVPLPRVRRAWQRKIGYIPQAIFISDDSVRRNVAFALEDSKISEESVWNALRAANLEEFVRDLPNGLDTVLGERGVRCSGGQRQRIGIARALYGDPEILVLDEATSALDSSTEAAIRESLSKLAEKKTMIVIAHRLSTVRNCRTLFLFEEGRLIDTGGFSEIHERNSLFRDMVAAGRLDDFEKERTD